MMTTESSSVTVPRRNESNRPEEPYALTCGPSLGRERVRRRVHPLPPSARIKNRPSWAYTSKHPSRALSLLFFCCSTGVLPHGWFIFRRSQGSLGCASRRSSMPDLGPLPFANLMDVRLVSVTPDLVIGELKVREELCTRPNVLHGGAYMAFADTIGAVATVANLKDGETTTTIESKTNFFAAIPLGDTARAECTPLHKGRSTMVWQTRITRGDGRLCAVVTQTQMVLNARV